MVSYQVSDGITTTLASAKFTVTGTNDVPMVTGAVTGSATEDGVMVTLNALANASDVDAGTTLMVESVPAVLPAGVSYDAGAHSFTLDPSHSDYQSLAQGQAKEVTVSYQVSDGITSTPALVKFTVTGTNDAPVVTGAVTGSATEDGVAVSLNALANASDVDAGTTLMVESVPAVLPAGVSYDAGAHSFTLDPSHSDYQSLAQGQAKEVTVSYQVSDGITSTPALVKFTVTGTNDAPVVTGAVTGSATEDDVMVTLDALANASDVDAGTTLMVESVPAVLPAGVSYDAGTHSFTLDPSDVGYQNLAQGQTKEVMVSYQVSDGITTTPASVKFTVTGTNDAPVVTGAVTGSATEDDVMVTLDALANASDVDAGTTLMVESVPAVLPAGVSYDAGTHSFTLDPSDVGYQNLAQGQTKEVMVSYQVSDGITTTPASVKFTVTGTNDAPVVTGAVTGSATEDGVAVTLNALANASDVDAGTTLMVQSVPAVLPAGVSYDVGTHSFTLDPSHSDYQSLAQGQAKEVMVSYQVSDGITTTPASVKFTVTGTNDAPVVTGAVTGSATEDDVMVTLDALANASDVDAGTTLMVESVPA
ncbi:VCBS repeat-containing protein, partial [Duganella sp. CF458]|uniref:VCBS domain-containing protein n=1 Tax=Duganella sp. CF458 TaxID=1884368 RepID=UPI0008F2409A